MRAWLYCLSGLLVWAGHFFALYAAASLLPGTLLARWASIALTILALGLLGLLFRQIWTRMRQARTPPADPWIDGLAGLVAAISAVSILLQGLPAIVG